MDLSVSMSSYIPQHCWHTLRSIYYIDLNVCLRLLYSLSANIGRSSSPFQSTVTVHWSASWQDTSKQRISSLFSPAHRPSCLYSSRRSRQTVPHWKKLVASLTHSRLDYSNAATFAGVADVQIRHVYKRTFVQNNAAARLVLKIETWHHFWKTRWTVDSLAPSQ